MLLNNPVEAAEMAALSQTILHGDENAWISGLNEIHKVVQGDLTFADHPKYVRKALGSAASAIIVKEKVTTEKVLLLSEDPFITYNQLVDHFVQLQFSQLPDAVVGEKTIVEPGVFLGKGVVIGKGCHIGANVSIHDRTVIGDNVTIKSNTVIGSDAFYFKKYTDGYTRMISCGRVVIHDDVHIGAGCTIDRGVSGDTIIGKGSKLDNLVMIGHGVEIGQHCIIAAQCGIAGKTILEDHVTLWGQVGVSKCLRIGVGAVVLAQSGVSKSLEGGKIYYGAPAKEAREMWKEIARMKR